MNKYSNSTNKQIDLTNSSTVNSSNSSSTNPASFNLVHMESTNMEEYDIVQNLIHKVIRDVRRERELHQIPSPLQILEENQTSSKSKSKLIGNSSNNKRAKSPKPNLYNIIQDTTSLMSHNNANSPNQNSPSSTSVVPFQSNNFSSGNSTGVNNSSVYTTNNSGSSSGNNLTSTKDSVKKNSSKFPFLQKILNKS